MSGLIGYFSKDECDKPGAILSFILSTNSITAARRFSLASVAEIACWGAHTEISRKDDSSLITTLSAAGLASSIDAEAKIAPHSLTLSRDEFGRAMIFWTQTNETVWFASRLDLLALVLSLKEISLAGLYGYTCFSYVPSPETTITGIHSIPAGSELRWSASDFFNPIQTSINDWREASSLIDDEEEAARRLKHLLEESIQDQISDIRGEPVGVFLSGGLDSSITAALLARAGVRVIAFTLDFGKYGLAEWPYAEMVAKALSIPLTRVDATPRQIKRALRSAVRALDLPFGDGVTAPLYLLNEAASRSCSIVFNGEGGDQLFAGWTNKPLIASGIYGANDEQDFRRHYLRTFHRLHGYEEAVFAPQALKKITDIDPFKWIEDALDPSPVNSLLHRLRRANLMLKGAQNIQPRATSLALARGLKVRSPFCYKPLASFTFEVAGDLFLRGPCEKYLLKRAIESWLPEEIIWREKRGMGVPLTGWCLGPARREVRKHLSSRALKSEGIFAPDLARRIERGELSGHIQGRRIGETLWLLLMWELWREAMG
ncbi:MAG: asparagine synthetase B family protein [Acidobacteriota bacterium]